MPAPGPSPPDASAEARKTGNNGLRPPVADLGTLHPEAASDIIVLHEFMLNRDRLLQGLFGRKLRRNPVRDDLIRRIMIEFARGGHQRVPYYIKAVTVSAAPATIRTELELLMHSGLIELQAELADKRTSLVVPTTKLVNFYNEQMPRLRVEVMRLLVQPPP